MITCFWYVIVLVKGSVIPVFSTGKTDWINYFSLRMSCFLFPKVIFLEAHGSNR